MTTPAPTAVLCPACGAKMNAAAIVCPHCGARRPGATPGLAGKLSLDEMGALIAIEGTHEAPAQGVLPTLILPHPLTHGRARAAELACTVIALPMVLVGALSLGLSRRRTRRSADETSGEAMPVLAMSGLGGLGMYSVLSFAGLSTIATIAVITGSIAALITRGVIRSHASSKRSRDLHRLARPDEAPRQLAPPPEPRPALPEAKVVPPRAAPVIAVSAPPVATDAPRATTTAAPGDEPSLLK